MVLTADPHAHYVWHGKKPPSLNVILAVRQAFSEIPDEELFAVLKDSRS